MRRHPRLPCALLLNVSWKDSRSNVQKIRAKCLDLSAEGARLETAVPIPLRTTVTLHCDRYGSLGAASVRHCVRKVLKYSIGLEFNSSLTLANQSRKRCLQELEPPADSHA